MVKPNLSTLSVILSIRLQCDVNILNLHGVEGLLASGRGQYYRAPLLLQQHGNRNW